MDSHKKTLKQDQCRRNAGDGASSTALSTRQSSSPLLAAMPFSLFHPFLLNKQTAEDAGTPRIRDDV